MVAGSGAGSYEARCEVGGFAGELERLRAQFLLSWRQEARLLQWLGLQDGQDVLELGSGPGYITLELLTLLPRSRIVAADVDREMLQYARSQILEPSREALIGSRRERAHLVQTTIATPGLAKGSFDFAVARLIFQHLHDPIACARETLQLLRPGGKLAIIDIDAALWGIVQPVEQRLSPFYAKAARQQAVAGGDRFIGRRLWRILQRAGFVDLHLEAFVYHSDELGLAPFEPQMDPARLRRAVEEGYLTPDEFGMIEAGYQRFLASPDAYILMVGLMACGSKPASPE
ncbi:MAG: methyltransferase domain-containing protein [Dehalococcoidia bacterium]